MGRHVAALLGLALLASEAGADPLFYSSVTSNDIDYIHTTDPDAFACLSGQGRARMEMPDKRGGPLFAEDVLIFEARYLDGAQIGIWAHPDLGQDREAEQIALPVARAIGKLPDFMRARLNHVVLHSGDETAFSEDAGRFFVMYSDNIAKRIGTRDLEETVFHESVHATLDIPHASAPRWRAAQQADDRFLTGYGADNPAKEDLAETMLIAYTALRHPDRLPAEVERAVTALTPNRFGYIADLLAESDIEAPRRSMESMCK